MIYVLSEVMPYCKVFSFHSARLDLALFSIIAWRSCIYCMEHSVPLWMEHSVKCDCCSCVWGSWGFESVEMKIKSTIKHAPAAIQVWLVSLDCLLITVPGQFQNCHIYLISAFIYTQLVCCTFCCFYPYWCASIVKSMKYIEAFIKRHFSRFIIQLQLHNKKHYFCHLIDLWNNSAYFNR